MTGMSLIEHWRCPACGIFDGPHDEGACDVCADNGIVGVQVEPYVLASQHQAAARIATLEKALDLAASDLRSEGHFEASKRAFRAARNRVGAVGHARPRRHTARRTAPHRHRPARRLGRPEL
jgi:hypothetical protein